MENLKNACQIKFFPSYSSLDELPQDEVVVLLSKEELLKKLGLENIESDSESVFIELRNLKVLDNGRS